jgi:dUTPase
MTFLGLIVFVLVLSSLQFHSKFKKLNSRLLKLEKINIKKEGIKMSEILKGLVGERCSLRESSGVVFEGTVLAVDDEWIKLSIVNKNAESIVIKRIDHIYQVSVIGK